MKKTKTKTKSRCRNLLTRFDFWGQMHQCGVQRKSGSVQDSSDKTSFNNCMCNLRIALSCPCLSFPSEQLMIITVVIIYNDSMQHLFRLSSIVTVHVYTPFSFVFVQVFRYRWYFILSLQETSHKASNPKGELIGASPADEERKEFLAILHHCMCLLLCTFSLVCQDPSLHVPLVLGVFLFLFCFLYNLLCYDQMLVNLFCLCVFLGFSHRNKESLPALGGDATENGLPITLGEDGRELHPEVLGWAF